MERKAARIAKQKLKAEAQQIWLASRKKDIMSGEDLPNADEPRRSRYMVIILCFRVISFHFYIANAVAECLPHMKNQQDKLNSRYHRNGKRSFDILHACLPTYDTEIKILSLYCTVGKRKSHWEVDDAENGASFFSGGDTGTGTSGTSNSNSSVTTSTDDDDEISSDDSDVETVCTRAFVTGYLKHSPV